MRAENQPYNYGNEPCCVCLSQLKASFESFVIKDLARDWSMAIETVLMSFSKSLSLF